VSRRSNRRLETQIRESRLKLEQKEIEIYESQLSAIESVTSDRFKKELEDPDESEWMEIGKEPDNERKLDSEEHSTLRNQAIKYYYRSPHARNIIRLIQKYVVGRGFLVDPESDNPDVAEVWKNFWRTNRMDLKKKEIVMRVMRDGEIFIRYFSKDDSLLIRFMNPAFVKEPDDTMEAVGNPTWGIETDKEDVEDILAIWYKNKRVLADEVHFHKIFSDSDVKRGRSYLEPIIPLIVMYDRWLKDRMKLNMVRAIVGLVKSVAGTPTQAANIATGYETNLRKAPDSTKFHKAPEGVSIFTTNQGVDYKMLSPNLQAADVHHDGRAILLAVATGSGLPEFMVTADASNSNFASTMVAEAPATQEFVDWQDFFKVVFGEMFEKVISTAIKKGLIPEYEIITKTEIVQNQDTGEDEEKTITERVKTSTEAKIIFPELVPRKILDETQALVLQSNQGWLSDRTASARLDLDFDEEQKEIESEQMPEDQLPKEEQKDKEFEKARQDQLRTQPIEKDKETET